ncbi:glucose-6-phosphate 1-dehydrogenase [Naumannella cuiyingiana]|uniref:Glucose-6-phosphate 1-dehydrogenase n=1 Tax=Naumannella cuiyingiana TaxID=1347891 RepID=A0A7Z0DAW3_9ACTN|nr:glucose-6-phosphate dehydrogenase [Naumannella cuiyingiana]NYI71923.1 glucose-6-phosphate 1-dehydrogenase [Naumannella cuiyingiana]
MTAGGGVDEPGARTSTLVILGASGDLTARLLLPGLGTLLAGQPEREVTIIGADREPMETSAWRELVRSALTSTGCPGEVAAETADRAAWQTVDLLDEESLRGLLGAIGGPAVLYFAVPPRIAQGACELLARIGLPSGIRLGLEKPFGTDGASAKAFNELLHGFVAEERVFRVDHFLGTSTVLNVLGFRFANRVWRPVWNADNIERIDVIFDETLALEGRAGYYDTAGALVDMIQSHLLLVMAVTMMEEPARIDATELRDHLAHVVRATRIWADEPATASRRARYTAGRIGERNVPDYVDEPDVDPGNATETLAELTVEVRNAHWAGVPVTLRSGKALGADRHQIMITFRPVAHLPEGLGADQVAIPNQLVLDLGPDRVALEITTNGADDWRDIEATTMSAALGPGAMEPYGQILAGMLDGDPLLSVRGDISEECWRIIDPVRRAWQANETPLETYPAGSDGPASWPRARQWASVD